MGWWRGGRGGLGGGVWCRCRLCRGGVLLVVSCALNTNLPLLLPSQ
jgi:hypothetical protein